MTVRYRQEITDWSKAGYPVPNHIYITDGNVLIGYVPVGGKEVRFKKPYRTWAVTRRKFKELSKKEIQKLQANQ